MIIRRRKRLSEWIDEFFHQSSSELMHPSWDANEKCLEPLVNIEDKEDEIFVTVDLPYVKDKNDIRVNISEDSLEIRAEIKKAIRWERWGTVQKYIEFKSFRKFIRLQSKVDPEKSRALFRGGILEISLPKVRRRFTIEIE